MRRREFLALLGGAAALGPRAAGAQQAGRVSNVLVWFGGSRSASDPETQIRLSAFRDALRALGWEEGRNVKIDYRWTDVVAEQPKLVSAELLARSPDAILTNAGPLVVALHRRTKTVPVVFTQVADPVGDGFVASLAQPGGNITGITIYEHAFAGKWLEMLKAAAPDITRVAVMQNSDHPAWKAYLRAIGTTASGLGIEVTPAPVTKASHVESALTKFARKPNGGVVILPGYVGTVHRELIVKLATEHRLPSINSQKAYPANGGLMSYGVETTAPYRQAAAYVDRILKGAKPAELPVQASNKFEMVINTKVAKAIGIAVPPTLLARADQVIE